MRRTCCAIATSNTPVTTAAALRCASPPPVIAIALSVRILRWVRKRRRRPCAAGCPVPVTARTSWMRASRKWAWPIPPAAAANPASIGCRNSPQRAESGVAIRSVSRLRHHAQDLVEISPGAGRIVERQPRFHAMWSSTESTDNPITLTPRFSNSPLSFAVAPSSVVQTGVYSLGCENSTPQEFPSHECKLIFPTVVSASKSGAMSPSCSAMNGPSADQVEREKLCLATARAPAAYRLHYSDMRMTRRYNNAVMMRLAAPWTIGAEAFSMTAITDRQRDDVDERVLGRSDLAAR